MNEPAAAAPAVTYESLASAVDLQLLAPELTDSDIADGCRLASEYSLRAVVVRPCDVDQAARWLRSPVILATVAGYPDGVSTTAAKLYEGRDLLRRGAREIEWVLNPARILSRQFQDVETEVAQIARSCEEAGAALTVVLRNELFADDQKIIATKIAKRVGAPRIGIAASAADIRLLLPLLKERLQIKAARGIEALDQALEARSLGCALVGSPAAPAILEAWRTQLQAQQTASQPVS